MYIVFFSLLAMPLIHGDDTSNLTTVTDDLSVAVSKTHCGGAYKISVGKELTLTYNGTELGNDEILKNRCRFSLLTNSKYDLCVRPDQFDIECNTIVEYTRSYWYFSTSPTKKYTCTTAQTNVWCTDKVEVMYLVVRKDFSLNGSNRTEDLQLTIYTNRSSLWPEKSDKRKDIDFDDGPSQGLIIGLVIGAFVVLCVVVFVIMLLFRRRKRRNARRQGGMVQYQK